ncbi:MAG: helix-turn-helix domain-containing protein [Chloracidobacterium sp.]|nr:helix-turn-helix domain-containing protein [Chloracidobacterium sp.]
MSGMTDRDLLVAKEVALLLRVDVQRVYELARTGQIPFILLGQRQYRWSRKIVERWLDTGGSQNTAEVANDV